MREGTSAEESRKRNYRRRRRRGKEDVRTQCAENLKDLIQHVCCNEVKTPARQTNV